MVGAGIIAGVVGYNLAENIPINGRLYLQIFFLALLVSMMILDTEPGWNIVLSLGFAVTAGALLSWSSVDIIQIKSWILFIGLVLITIIGGNYLSKDIGRSSGFLYPSAVLYMVGWILFLFLNLPAFFFTIWTYSGMVLFVLITMAVLIRGKTNNQKDSIVPIIIQLFIGLFNLFWLSAMI
jgi:hypothetical protein